MTDEQAPNESDVQQPKDARPPVPETSDGQPQSSPPLGGLVDKFKELPTVAQILIPVGAMSLLLGFCCCGGCIVFFGDKDGDNGGGSGKAEKTISAVALFEAYSSNEAAADDEYKGKILEVTGVIDSVGKGLFDKIYIALKENNTQFTLGAVRCNVTEDAEDDAKKLSKGQRVTIRGKCDGQAGPIVKIEDCVIVD
jgi:hypothetical protein